MLLPPGSTVGPSISGVCKERIAFTGQGDGGHLGGHSADSKIDEAITVMNKLNDLFGNTLTGALHIFNKLWKTTNSTQAFSPFTANDVQCAFSACIG